MIDLKVLYIEDSERDAILIDLTLKKYEINVASKVVDDEKSILDALKECAWDIVISDCNLPLISVERALELVHQYDKDLPYIAISGAIGEEEAVDLLKKGAHDFVSKGNLTRLVPAIRREIKEAEHRRARRVAENELKESEERFQLAMKGATDGLWDWNLVTDEVYFSERWCDMLGYRSDEIAPSISSFWALVHDDDRSQIEKILGRQMEVSTDKYEIEYRMKNKNGSFSNILSRGFYVEADGHPVRMVGTHVDITARKESEIALLQSQKQLRELSAHLQKVREEEKIHIAKEVHDELGATLTALNLDIHWLQKRLAAAHSDIKDKVTDMAQLVNEAAGSCRRIVTELRPSVLDDLGLIPAIEWQAKDFSNRNDVPCKVTTNVDVVNLDGDQTIVIFRIFQEALTNVARHAKASRVEVIFLKTESFVTLQVIDDGIGFNIGSPEDKQKLPNDEVERVQPKPKPGSYGIRGMKERALSVGGTIEFESHAEFKGSRVILTIPLNNES